MKTARTSGKRSNSQSQKPRAVRKPVTTTITVTFRHVASSDALRRYAERKFSHLGKFLKRACEAHLILSVDKYRQRGEVTIKSGRLTATAEQEAKDLYSAIDLLEDKVVRQLTRHVEKLAARRVRSLSTGELMSEAEGNEPGQA